MTILPANEAHIPGMIALLRQVGEVHHRIRPDIFVPGTQKYDEAALTELLKDESRPIYIAECEGAVAGYCFCVIKDFSDGIWEPHKEFYIDDLCVDETMRRMGIAKALYDHALQQAKRLHCHSLTLNVWCGNDGAMEFYKKQGLQPRNIMMEQKL